MNQLLTCKWTVHVGQATSLIRLPDPSDLEPEYEHTNEGVRDKFECITSAANATNITPSLRLAHDWTLMGGQSKLLQYSIFTEIKNYLMIPCGSSPSPPVPK